MNDDVLSALEKRLASAEEPEIDTTETHRDTPHIGVTVSELQAAAESNPSHPHAVVYLKAVRGLEDSRKVFVPKVDLQALLQNREVDHVRTIEGKERVVRKQLGATL